MQKLDYDPDEMLDLAIRAWCKDPTRDFPSRSASYTDTDRHIVVVANNHKTLAIYRIVNGGVKFDRYGEDDQ